MRPTIRPNEVVICDGQRPQGMICPRGGAYEAHLADGQFLGPYPTVQTARAAVIEADRKGRAR
jgi:hypothetical protein